MPLYRDSGKKILPIYLFLLQELAHLANIMAGDDSKTRVRNMEKEASEGFQMDRSKVHSMVKAAEEKLGRVFQRKAGTGSKSQLNVSHIHGLTDPHNARSIIYIFRTHFGIVGDLLSKLLELRPADASRIIFQVYDYRLCLDNNRSERLLRGEKILLVSCKFRWSETGRVSFDVLRSLLMTARGACGNPYTNFCWVLKKPKAAIAANPELYTPLRFHQIRESKVDDQEYICWYLKDPEEDVKARPHDYSPLAFRKIKDASATDLQATGT